MFYYTSNQLLLFIVFGIKDIQLYNTEYILQYKILWYVYSVNVNIKSNK